MLYIDSRVGSAEFAGSFSNFGIPTCLENLPFGDFSFIGNGPAGEGTISVGIERKTLSDILTCMRDGRFSGHQLPGLLDNFHRVILLVEGRYRPNPEDGILEESRNNQWFPVRGRFMYRELSAFLVTMEEMCNVRVVRTWDKKETVFQIVTWYKWYQKKWEDHTGHLILHKRTIGQTDGVPGVKLIPASLVRKVASCIDSISDVKSARVEEKFQSVFDMVNADISVWMQLKGIGKKTATDIFNKLRGIVAVDSEQALAKSTTKSD